MSGELGNGQGFKRTGVIGPVTRTTGHYPIPPGIVFLVNSWSLHWARTLRGFCARGDVGAADDIVNASAAINAVL